MTAFVILGIDPGSRATGYAAVEQTGRRLRMIESGTIALGGSEPLSARLAALLDALDGIVARLGPRAVAVEDVFTARNARSALLLGHARGVALAAAGRHDIAVHAYPPATVKRAVGGHGRADKEQLRRMVQVLLGLRRLPAEDEADAMAVAICHALRRSARGVPAAREGARA